MALFSRVSAAPSLRAHVARPCTRNMVRAMATRAVQTEQVRSKSTSAVDADQAPSSSLLSRFTLTAEVTVSKIFPAGFGWQGASCVADSMGLTDTDMSFFLMTGVGDALGVAIGHYVYYSIKNALGWKQDMEAQKGASVLLGTACVFSGTAWQPIVNFLHGTADLSFTPTALGTVVGCGSMFFLGLRAGRMMWSPVMKVDPNSYANLKADAQLSLAVGGATGAFVGTDVSFVSGGVDSNWLRPLVGVEDGTADLMGMCIAGSSTSLGFATFQSAQNFVVPKGKAWVD